MQDALMHITASLLLITKTGNHGKKLVWFDWFREMRLKAREQCALCDRQRLHKRLAQLQAPNRPDPGRERADLLN